MQDLDFVAVPCQQLKSSLRWCSFLQVLFLSKDVVGQETTRRQKPIKKVDSITNLAF